MNVREVIGLLLGGVGAITFPFGYWVASIFYPIGVGLCILGGFLTFTGRRARKGKRDGARYSHPNYDGYPPPVGETKGFHGSAIRESDSASADDGTD